MIFRCELGRLLAPLQPLSPGVGEQDPGLLLSTASHISYPSFLPTSVKLPKPERKKKDTNLDPKKTESSSSSTRTDTAVFPLMWGIYQ